MDRYVIPFNELGIKDIEQVGGKNASLGEMIRHLEPLGVRVPGGFATTAEAYREFLSQGGLDTRIYAMLAGLDVGDMEALARAGAQIRQWVRETPMPQSLEAAIREAWQDMQAREGAVEVAVRSSATAEDLPTASFAGQQETYLNVRGIDPILLMVREVFASLFNDRAIAYRVHQGFAHERVALSAGVQRMVRSDLGASGVIFTIDTESGFRDAVFITAAYGLGETVVQGQVNPDEFYVHKPTLAAGRPAVIRRSLGSKAIRMIYTEEGKGGSPVRVVHVPKDEARRFALGDAEVEALARHAVVIERHYGRPMDIEWGKDGKDGRMYILQARPETVRSQATVIERYTLGARGEVLVSGRSIGEKIGTGPVRVIRDVSEIGRVQAGDVLVTDMTDPDWEPVMKRAAAIVTNRGGRTCHAAIIAREMGIPAVVGCGDATERLRDGQAVTVSCAEGDTGYIYAGALDYSREEVPFGEVPELPVKVMMNVANPESAFQFQALPNQGVGLARLEFVINRMIGVHPRALLALDEQPEPLKSEIRERMSLAGHDDPVGFYVGKLTEGIATLAAAFWPKPVIVRLSDFKSNEYANLLGGRAYEPDEENPMIGLRGAGRYVSEAFRDCAALECRALKQVRDVMGLTNVEVMIPFVRTVDEAEKVVELLAGQGLKRGENGLRLIMMCEIPANALLADAFLEHFDGFSIGSNDLTQLTLGVDRDSGLLVGYDERNPAVLALMKMAIAACRKQGKYIGICGQAPSDWPEITRWLVREGIESVSLNPDSVLPMIRVIQDAAG